jgi:phage FluMu protein Com
MDYEIRCYKCEYLLAEIKGYEGKRIHTQQVILECPQCGDVVAGYLVKVEPE